MAKPEISLRPIESTVTQAAVQLYAAYVTAGKVKDGQEKEWMQRAVREAVLFARTAEGLAASQGEQQPDEASCQGSGETATEAVVGPAEAAAIVPLGGSLP